MKSVPVLVCVAAVLCVLDAAPARKEEEQKRGGVSSSLHGNFYRSMHHPLFARGHAQERRSYDENQDKQKKVADKDKKFVDILGTSWASTETDPWGQSDPWGNSWGDPWSDDTYNYYYYVPWPRLNKRGKGAKKRSKRSATPVDRSDRDYSFLFAPSNHGGHSNTPSWSDHFAIQNENYYSDDDECSYCCYDYDNYCYNYCYDYYYDNCDDYYYDDDYDQKVKKDISSKTKDRTQAKKSMLTDKLAKKSDRQVANTLVTDKQAKKSDKLAAKSLITDKLAKMSDKRISKALVTNKQDKKSDKRVAEKTKKDKKYFDHFGNYVAGSYYYYYPSYPTYAQYPQYGNPWGKKHKRALKKIHKDKKGNYQKNKKDVFDRDYIWLIPQPPQTSNSGSDSRFQSQSTSLFDYDYDDYGTAGYYRRCYIYDTDEDNDGYYDYYCGYFYSP